MTNDVVTFPDGETGSTLLRAALANAAAEFPTAFEGLSIPDSGTAFKRQWAEVVGAFEARRTASPDRLAIARHLAAFLPGQTHYGSATLAERFDDTTAPDAVEVKGTRPPGWVPELTWRGQTFAGSQIGELADRLREACQITEAGTAALQWVAEERLQEPLVLSDLRFALLGAGAELAPTSLLLQAGARVLWVDRQAPNLDPSTFSGTLVQVPGADDLLTDTPVIQAAVAREASAGPLHLGLYAYAPGRGRELRLTAAMNEVAAHTDPASVILLVSPTTPGEVSAGCRADRASRTARVPGWQRALRGLGALGGIPHHEHDEVQIARSIVGLQGPTYQAAQYLGKMMVAEAWAADRAPMRISANVAGITQTRSLEHPLFLAGFLGAPSFGIQIFNPDQTRVLMALLLLHDIANPQAASALPDPLERARGVVGQSIHGGVRSAPFALDPTIRVAALLGLSKQPSLLMRLARGK
ncbi:MAG: hypothetical protein AAGA48_23685 [Myxococcota bacterium]